jgi:DNA helicase-2/ATP-dependent DNA helicase PcrA
VWNKKKKSFAGSSSGFQYSPQKTEESAYPSLENAKFPKGTKIQHQLYGQGIIVVSEGSGEQEKVTIKFYDGTLKKFIAKFTPMEKLTEQDLI